MHKILLLGILFLGLVGCSLKEGTAVQVEGAKDEFEVKLLFVKDGCSVYRFYDGRSHYFTNCSGQTMTTQSQRSGKTTKHWDENIGGK